MPNSLFTIDGLSIVLLPLAVALVGFCAIWPLSLWRRDASLVDIVWGPGFAIQALIVASLIPQIGARGMLVIGLMCIWSARIGFVLIRRRWRAGHEDGRYTAVRDSWGPSFWWKSLFIVFVLQAFLQWLIALGPFAGIMAANQSLGALAIAGGIVAFIGLGLETLADHELDQFKATRTDNSLLTTGLRAHIRHPNYAGEIVFWSGIALICIDGGAWLGLASPILIALFLLKISGAPMLDERLSATRPEYAAYKKSVPAFVPRFGVRRAPSTLGQ